MSLAEEHTSRLQQSGFAEIPAFRPARGPEGRDPLVPPCPQDRSRHRNHDRRNAARAGDQSAPVEHVRRIGIERIPPAEEGPWNIDRHVQDDDERLAQARRPAERPGRPLGRAPERDKDDKQDEDDLPEEVRAMIHDTEPDPSALQSPERELGGVCRVFQRSRTCRTDE